MTEVSRVTPPAHAVSGRGLLSSAWWMTGSHIVAQGFAYGSLILLARWLPPASFGTVAVGTAVMYVAVLFVDRGTWGGIIVQKRLTRADLTRAFRRCLLTAIALAAAMAAVAGVLVDRFASGGNSAAVAALALCLPLHAVSVVPMALLQKSMQFRRLGGLTAIANVGSALVALLMALDGFGVWALVARQVVLSGMLAALSAALCLGTLRASQLTPTPTPSADRTPNAERWFFLFAVALVLATNLDYLVIGNSANASVVGLYALAFTIAMAPSTHFSEQVGKVLFAAAASHPESTQLRTEQAVRLMSMLMLPLLPVGILAAPALLPTVLGDEWGPMVVPFQVLLAVGVGHAIVNCIGEALSGNGHMAFRAKVMVARCVATLLALLILVPIDGIRGAALAQLVVFTAYAAIYATAGARRAGTSPAALWRGVRPVAVTASIQMVVGSAVLVALASSEAAGLIAACAAALVGLAAASRALFRTCARMWSS